MVIEARDAEHAAEIRDRLESGGFPVLSRPALTIAAYQACSDPRPLLS